MKKKYTLGAGIFFGRGVPNIMGGGGGHKFLERMIGGHKIFDDQNVGSHKMTTDSVFILFKDIDFNTIFARLGGKVYRWWRGSLNFCCRNKGVPVLSTPTFFVNLGPPFRRKCQPPYCPEHPLGALNLHSLSTNSYTVYTHPHHLTFIHSFICNKCTIISWGNNIVNIPIQQ